jgi:hypothetical protein
MRFWDWGSICISGLSIRGCKTSDLNEADSLHRDAKKIQALAISYRGLKKNRMLTRARDVLVSSLRAG